MGPLRRNVGLIDTKGCSKLVPFLQSPPLMSRPDGPFSTLIICVTGLSKGHQFHHFQSLLGFTCFPLWIWWSVPFYLATVVFVFLNWGFNHHVWNVLFFRRCKKTSQGSDRETWRRVQSSPSLALYPFGCSDILSSIHFYCNL